MSAYLSYELCLHVILGYSPITLDLTSFSVDHPDNVVIILFNTSTKEVMFLPGFFVSVFVCL